MRTEWRKGFWSGYSSAVVGVGSGAALAFLLTGCAGFQEVASGAAMGVAEAAPAALEQLVSGGWGSALVTLVAGAAAGGAGLFGMQKRAARKKRGGRRRAG